jgi:putative acetyltransferase
VTESAARHTEIAAEPLESRDARALIAQLDAELTERYPDPRDNHLVLTPEQIGEAGGVFLVARQPGGPVGCAALRRLDAATGEVKRMYVMPAARGHGIGSRLVAELEDHARKHGFRRLVLETGERQPESIGLYQRHGFVRIPRFGDYVNSPRSVCMEKRLT